MADPDSFIGMAPLLPLKLARVVKVCADNEAATTAARTAMLTTLFVRFIATILPMRPVVQSTLSGSGFRTTLRGASVKTVMVEKEKPADDDLSGGDRRALDELFTMTYEELRRLAAVVRRSNPSATLNPTALVNEAWLKLSGSPEIGVASELHFKRIAARAMRQVLVDG